MSAVEKSILCYGDSNTFGSPPMQQVGDFGRYDKHTRWPCVMKESLGPKFHLIEEGLGARTTVHSDPVEGEHKNGLHCLLPILESHRPLDYFVLMLGTNDLKARFGVSAREIAISVQRLLQVVQQCGTDAKFGALKVLLISPPVIFERGVCGDFFHGGREKSMALAEHYQNVAHTMGVEFLSSAELVDSDTPDGIHLSAESHRVLGRAVAAKIKMMDNS